MVVGKKKTSDAEGVLQTRAGCEEQGFVRERLSLSRREPSKRRGHCPAAGAAAGSGNSESHFPLSMTAVSMVRAAGRRIEKPRSHVRSTRQCAP